MIIPIIPTRQYLDELRSIADLSDEKISEAVGLDRTTIWRLRTGKHKSTATEHGIRIANFHAKIFKQAE